VFGAGTGGIWLDNVRCTGKESDIGSCPHRGLGVHSCSHSEDVSISCATTETQALPGKDEHGANSERTLYVHICCVYFISLYSIPLAEKGCLFL